MEFPRSSGVLLPVFSLPHGPGIGDLGEGAYRFVDFLKSAGQTIWQLLPLGPPALGNSPYSSYSAFAGNPLLISCDALLRSGLLALEDLNAAGYSQENQGHVNYAQARAIKIPLLEVAFLNFKANQQSPLHPEFAEFCTRNESWLTDFARFDAIAADTGNPDWSTWDATLVRREPAALQTVDNRLVEAISFSKFQQFLFAKQWQQLKTYANAAGIRMYGDMPIFVAYESVDVWTNQNLFLLNAAGRPVVVAGVPPDYFSTTGQKWGNPLYDWSKIADQNYAWWTSRFRQAFEFYDILRIDHFRGFESYWEIPADAETAIDGQWMQGPGEAPFHAAQAALGELAIVAEDLGLITDEVHALRERLGFPGMRVLQFGCDNDDDPYHRPDSYPSHCVAYTGTHDNDTLMGWYNERQQNGTDNSIVDRFLADDGQPVYQHLIQSVLNSSADTAVIPMQDLLGLGSEARTNTPGRPDKNWGWRCKAAELSDQLAAELKSWTEASDRSIQPS
ncbi:MAG: 4-alpha-glucanotransferase [Fuerstiella sp.]